MKLLLVACLALALTASAASSVSFSTEEDLSKQSETPSQSNTDELPISQEESSSPKVEEEELQLPEVEENKFSASEEEEEEDEKTERKLTPINEFPESKEEPQTPPSPPTQTEQCALCLATWRHAIAVYNGVEDVEDKHGRYRDRRRTTQRRHMITTDDAQRDGVRIGDGIITEEKVCRAVCPAEIREELSLKTTNELDAYTCDACKTTVFYLRTQRESFNTIRMSARNVMCRRFHTQAVRDDCMHTVHLYSNSIREDIEIGLSPAAVCRNYKICNAELRMGNEEERESLLRLFDEDNEPLRREDIEDLEQWGFTIDV
jgi:hypothetical protein